MRDLVHDLPISLNAVSVAGLTTPPAPFVPAEHQFATGYALLLTGFGDPAEYEQVVHRVRSTLPPLFDLVTPMPYVALQGLLDEPNAWGSYGYDKGAYLADLTDDAIDVLTAYVPKKSSPLSVLVFYWLDGAYAQVADEATAFGGPRTRCYFGSFIGLCPTQEMLPAERQWIRALANDLSPYTLGSGTYVNVMPEPDVSDVQDVYGGKFTRLQAVKAKLRSGQRLSPQRQHPARSLARYGCARPVPRSTRPPKPGARHDLAGAVRAVGRGARGVRPVRTPLCWLDGRGGGLAGVQEDAWPTAHCTDNLPLVRNRDGRGRSAAGTVPSWRLAPLCSGS